MDRLEAMRLYTRIVELGSFTAAADDLNLPRATVTHAIKRLEKRLGAQLLQRTTRRVSTTRDGETYYGHCVRLLADMDEVEADFREAAVQPKGRLRVDLSAALARLLVIPALPAFLRALSADRTGHRHRRPLRRPGTRRRGLRRTGGRAG